MESLENHYDDISVHRQSVKIRKISVKFPHNETMNISYQIHFEIRFSNSFDTFQILHIFQSKVLGKLGSYYFKSYSVMYLKEDRVGSATTLNGNSLMSVSCCCLILPGVGCGVL